MGLDRELHELLYCHDCVIVPHWGGFLTHYRPARLDEARKLVHPPGKEVSFNRHLTRNDGLLVDQLARKEGLDFDEANARIEQEVSSWRVSLEENGRVELPHIGIFYRDAERNLQFDPDKRGNFLKDAYGLRPVAAVPVVRIRQAPVVPVQAKANGAVVKELPIKAEVPATDRRTRVVWAAAATVALLFMVAAVWAYRLSDRNGVQWSSLELPWSIPDPRYSSPAMDMLPEIATAKVFSLPEGLLGVQTLPLTPDDSVFVTVDLGTPVVEEVIPDKTAVVMPSTGTATSATRSRFHVVGGCFADPSNAERFHAELVAKGYPAVRLPRYGELEPVAYGSYALRSEAVEALASVRAGSSASAWLLVR